MNVLVVVPMAHRGRHHAAHTKSLVNALVRVGADVTLLNFNGLLGGSNLDKRVKHISFVSENNILVSSVRFLPRLVPGEAVRIQIDRFVSTVCTFFEALRQIRRGKYQAIHILDAHIYDFTYPGFASSVSDSNLVFTLFYPSKEVDMENWGVRFREALSKRHVMMGLELLLIRLLYTGPVTALKKLLQKRGTRKNRLAFVCYTNAVRDSYSGSPFYNRIVRMSRGIELPEARPLAKDAAREYLGLAQNRFILLHFGSNHIYKNLEVIFEALRDLKLYYRMVFAGKAITHLPNAPSELAKRYGLQHNIMVVDRYITDEEAKYYFYAAYLCSS